MVYCLTNFEVSCLYHVSVWALWGDMEYEVHEIMIFNWG